MEKRFEDLTFADDGMFQAVLRDPAISAELVELLLGVQVDHVEYPELEKVIEPFYTSKGVVHYGGCVPEKWRCSFPFVRQFEIPLPVDESNSPVLISYPAQPGTEMT